LLLRVTDGEAARLLAKLMGEAELDEKEETLSYGLNSSRDGVSVFARRNLRDIVLTSQVLTLPDMTGYITIPGDYPVAKVTYHYEPNPTIAEGFKERTGFGINFLGGLPGPQAGTSGTPAAAPGTTPVSGGNGAVSENSPESKPKKPRKKTAGAVTGAAGPVVERLEPELFGDDFPEPEDSEFQFNELDEADMRREVTDRETREIIEVQTDRSRANSGSNLNATNADAVQPVTPTAAGMLKMEKKTKP
jgi:hypothetical protein